MSKLMGRLFKNSYKKEGSKQPDWSGAVNIPGGGEIKLVGWWSKDKNQNDYINFQADTPKESAPPRKPEPKFQEDADIPW